SVMGPLVGIYSALTRAGLDGSRSWTENEALTLDQALHGYTSEGAGAWHTDEHLGVIREGADADIVAWSADLYALDPAGVLEQRADLTIVGGEVVHDASGSSHGTRFDLAAKTLNPTRECSGHAHEGSPDQ